MLIIKPSWLTHSGEHKDFEVYTCHVSPDGKRLATAGGDGHVRIWSTDAIFHANDSSYDKPRQLCHMSHHLGTIHSVRFSPNNRYLASGADDKIICIYQLDKSPPTVTFGTNEPPPVENWKTTKRLVGHENDVQDLGWSYDSSVLVSVGLDSKIVVWSGHTFEKLKTISAHQSHVKGITFDPANKFFATASDDRTVKIFRFTPPGPTATAHDMVNNFVLETTVSGPFKTSPLTTYFRRCSWSPDGNHIAAANAVNGPVPSAAIIERGTWESEIHLIGHEAPTEVCSFSPRLFYTKKPEESSGANGASSNRMLVTVIASAGQDKGVSIWNTTASRPLLIVQNIGEKSVSDLAWTPDGQTLFASNLDGSVVALRFETGELGWPALTEENDKILSKYGGTRKGMGTAEDVDGLLLEEHSRTDELRGAENRMGALMGDLPSKDSPAPANGIKGSGTATPSATTNGAGGAGVAAATPEDTSGSKPAAEDGSQAAADKDKAKQAARITELKSRVTITKDGKKRVAPLLVSSSGTGQSSLPQSQLVGATSTKTTQQQDAPQSILDLSKPYDGLPRGGIATMLLGNKRKVIATEGDEADAEHASKKANTGPVPIMINGVDGVEPATLQPVQNGQVPTPEFIRPAVINPALAVSQIRLGVPKVRTHILRPLERGVLQGQSTLEEATRIPENIVFEAKNPVQAKDPSHVTATKRGVLLWQDFLPRAVLLVTGNKNFWAAACEDGSVYVWTPAGRRLINALVLDAQPVILESRDHWLLAITAVGLAHVWNLQTMSSPHPPVSLAPILDVAVHSLNQHSATPGPGITSAHLNSTGHIVVTLTNADGYFYSPNMCAWQRLSEPWWAVGSQYWNSNDSSVSALQSTAVGPVSAAKDEKKAAVPGAETSEGASAATVSAGIVPFLERHTTTEFLLRGRAYALQRIVKTLMSRPEFSESFESTVSIAHLENRLAGCLQLGARDEFRLYLFMYAKRIGAEALRGKVEELLNDLAGGVLVPRGGDARGGGRFGSGDEICGWDRRELLKGVVMILGKYRELQRLTVQYARILDLTKADHDDDDAGSGNAAADGAADGGSGDAMVVET